MLHKKLRICTWNINGYYSRTVGTKFLDRDFLKNIKGVDLLCLTETHIHSGTIEHLGIPGFRLLGHKIGKKNKKFNTDIAIFQGKGSKSLYNYTEHGDTIWVNSKRNNLEPLKIYF